MDELFNTPEKVPKKGIKITRPKPFRVSFKLDQTQKMSLEQIEKEISDFSLKFSQSPCCSRACSNILKPQLVQPVYSFTEFPGTQCLFR